MIDFDDVKRDKPFSGLDSIVGLNSSDSRESPARSTSTLVLNSGNLAFLPPVLGRSSGAVGAVGKFLFWGGGREGDVQSEVLFFLSNCHGCELVDSWRSTGVDATRL